MALEHLPTSLISKMVQRPHIGARLTVTLVALFEARQIVNRPNALYLHYAFLTTDDVAVHSYGSVPLKAAHYSENLSAPVQDVRNAFVRPGWYTLGKERAAVVEWTGGYWRLVSLEDAKSKEGAK